VTPDVPTKERAGENSADVSPSRTAWVLALVPLALLAALLIGIVWSDPARSLRPENYPLVERLAFQRVMLDETGIVVSILNDGPDVVTIAQVQVDDAYWMFSAEPGTELRHLGRTTLRIPYPWVEGEAHIVKVLTSTGTPFEYEIAVAVSTPKPSGRFLAVFALIGLYVGVIPVAIGLLWFPFLARLSSRNMDFLLALTVGLLLFLLVDGAHEGLESGSALPDAMQGTALFVLSAFGAFLLLEGVGGWLRRQKGAGTGDGSGDSGAWVLAVLIAVGIGLHNFGEGLAIGSAFALGEAALGSLLIVGFTLHNTTEGLAIVAPLARARQRVGIGHLVRLGLIGGVPTIAGAWLGGFVYSPVWAVLFLALGVGAIAQVVFQIVRQLAGDRPVVRQLAQGSVLAGLLAGFGVMYATGMLVG
jgi:ZIP family zinc transporter